MELADKENAQSEDVVSNAIRDAYNLNSMPGVKIEADCAAPATAGKRWHPNYTKHRAHITPPGCCNT